jgi:hypothetical protein
MTIKFGDANGNAFSVHQGLICYHSAYFRGALQDQFTEGKEGVATLPQEEDDFKVFMSWMYTGRFYDEGQKATLTDGTASRALFSAYVFADKRGIPALKNAIIDMAIELEEEENVLPGSDVNYVWDNLPESDGLRKLFLDWQYHNTSSRQLVPIRESTSLSARLSLQTCTCDP